MKNALILHGTANTSQGNWFPWLSGELVKNGYSVWSPDLPEAIRPDAERYISYIRANPQWKFDADSVIIGHSSGGVAALKLLQSFPPETVVNTVITVGAFVTTHGWEDIQGLFTVPFDFPAIKSHAKRFIVFHSDNDPYVPQSDAEALVDLLRAEYVFIPGQGHFNLEKGPQYKQFPELLAKIPGVKR